VVNEKRFFPDVMPGWPLPGVVLSGAEQALHRWTVLLQNVAIAGLWPVRFREPPQTGVAIFEADAFDSYPLSRRGESCRIMTNKFLAEFKPTELLEAEERAQRKRRHNGPTRLPSVSQLNDDRPLLLEKPSEERSELCKPGDVLIAGIVTVFLFAIQREGRRSKYELYFALQGFQVTTEQDLFGLTPHHPSVPRLIRDDRRRATTDHG